MDDGLRHNGETAAAKKYKMNKMKPITSGALMQAGVLRAALLANPLDHQFFDCLESNRAWSSASSMVHRECEVPKPVLLQLRGQGR
jgi:hypothetical protein